MYWFQKLSITLMLVGCVFFLFGACIRVTADDDSFRAFAGAALAWIGGFLIGSSVCVMAASVWMT